MRRTILSLAAVLTTLFPTAASSAARFWALPHLTPGDNISYAYSISSNGQLVVGESFSKLVTVHGEGARWERAGLSWKVTGMGLPATPTGAQNSPALGVADDRTVTVGRCSFSTPPAPNVDTEAYCWSHGVFKMLPMLREYVVAQAEDATEGGFMIVGRGAKDLDYRHDARPLAWSGSFLKGWTPTELSTFEGDASGLDFTGRLAVGWTRMPAVPSSVPPGGARTPTVWRRTGPTWSLKWLPALPPDRTRGYCNGIATHGGFVAGASGDVTSSRPVLWRISAAGTYLGIYDLGMLDKFTTGLATAVADHGARVVGYCSQELPNGVFHYEALVWERKSGLAKLRDRLLAGGALGVNGWSNLAATGISDDGTFICGYGTDPSGEDRGWVAFLSF